MEDDVRQLLRLLFERGLEVGVVEEARVGQAGGEDLAVALDDLGAAVGRLDIGGADEGVGQRAVACSAIACSPAIAADEILLVHARGELDDFRRHAEEFGVEAAEQRHRPFGQPGILGDQPLVLDQHQPGVGGERGGAVADQGAAFVLIDDDVAGAQLFDIIRRGADRDLSRMVEAVAVGGDAAADTGDLDIDQILTEQRDDAVQRTDPAQAFGRRGGRTPAHRFRPGKGADDRGNRLGEHLRRGAAGLFGDRVENAVTLGQLIAGEAGLAEESVERLRGRGGLGALDLLADRLRLDGQIAGDQRQPARRGIGSERGGVQAGLGKLRREQAGEIVARLVLHAGGDLFGAEFEEEVGHWVAPKKEDSGCSRGDAETRRRRGDWLGRTWSPGRALRRRRSEGGMCRIVRASKRSARSPRFFSASPRLRVNTSSNRRSITPTTRCAPSRRRTRPSRGRGRGRCRPGVRRRR